MVNQLLFSNEGTLLALNLADSEIIYPHHKVNEISRGGLFWCVPNFDTEEGTFDLRHGEYRKTKDIIIGETRYKNIQGSWGSLETETTWKKSETSLTTSIFITVEKGETALRPGIHPYFRTENLVKIVCGTESFFLSDLTQSEMLVLKDTITTASLVYKNYVLDIKFEVSTSKLCGRSTILWTDNPSYVCIEFCAGTQFFDKRGLPLHLALQKKDTLSSTFSVTKKLI